MSYNLPEWEESANDAMHEAWSIPWYYWDLSGYVFGPARRIKTLRHVFTQDTTNHSQWIANWKDRNTSVNGKKITNHTRKDTI